MRALLMGGQACVSYGAAELSRATDFAILASPRNLERLGGALSELGAEPIAVPPLGLDYLKKGHAVHFRCQTGDAAGLRVESASRWPGARARCLGRRPLLSLAAPGRERELDHALLAEERAERRADEEYWRPLKAELEGLRHRAAKQRRGRR